MSTHVGIPSVFVVPFGFTEESVIIMHMREYLLMSTFLHVRSVLCHTCARASIGGSAFPCIQLDSSGRCTSACFELALVGRCSRHTFVVLVRRDRSIGRVVL